MAHPPPPPPPFCPIHGLFAGGKSGEKGSSWDFVKSMSWLQATDVLTPVLSMLCAEGRRGRSSGAAVISARADAHARGVRGGARASHCAFNTLRSVCSSAMARSACGKGGGNNWPVRRFTARAVR